MFLADTPGPGAGELSSERLRFARPAEGIPEHSLDQCEDAKRATVTNPQAEFCAATQRPHVHIRTVWGKFERWRFQPADQER